MLKTHETMFINGREVKLTEKRRAAEFTETLNNDAEYTAINSVLQKL